MNPETGMLYKVAAPRDTMVFEPSRFWRTEDWSKSSTRSKPGYIEDCVLYAAEFDEVNIHLLPPIRRLRVWRVAEVERALETLGHKPSLDARAILFANKDERGAIENFSPTI